MDSTFDVFLAVLVLLSICTVFFAQAWLIIIISRQSPVAALLCLVVPFLPLFFIKEHWNEARRPAILWLSGACGYALFLMLVVLSGKT